MNFDMVNPYLDLRGPAWNGLRKIAVGGLKPRGARMDAVFYPAGCTAAVPLEVAGGDPERSPSRSGAGAAQAGYQRPEIAFTLCKRIVFHL